MMRSIGRLAAAGFLCCLAACAGMHEKALPPVLSLEERSCADRPDLAGALVLTLVPKKPVPVEAAFSAASPCLRRVGGARSVYAVVALPESPEEYLVSVTSIPVGVALLSPHIQVLDAEGKAIREIPRDRFTFHGSSLYAGLRVHSNERYLVVASDPDTVGQKVSQIVSSTQATTMAVGTGTVMVYTGSEGNLDLVFAHSGRISVLAEPVPKAE